MTVPHGEKIKVKITIIAEISSGEYKNTDSMIDELSSESFYTIESTDNVTVHNTEYVDCTLIQ
jgi:hypothetical protein